MNDTKVYVDVEAVFKAEGGIIPYTVMWEDGHKYSVDKVLDIRRAASLKAGGTGIRYTVKIGRTTTFLFLDDDRWFVERR